MLTVKFEYSDNLFKELKDIINPTSVPKLIEPLSHNRNLVLGGHYYKKYMYYKKKYYELKNQN